MSQLLPVLSKPLTPGHRGDFENLFGLVRYFGMSSGAS